MTLSVVNLAGALNAMLIAIVLVAHPRLRTARTSRYLAGMLACAAVAIVLITLEHANVLWPRTAIWRIEESVSVLSGFMLLGYVSTRLGLGPPSRWLIAPWIGHAVAALLVPQYLGMGGIMWVQMGYTAFAAWLVWQSGWANRGNRHVLAVLAVFAWVHLAQLVRWVWSDVEPLRDIVPWATSAAFFCLTAVAVAQSRATYALLRAAADPDARSTMDALVEDLERHMRDSAPWRRPDVSLEALARQLGTSPSSLSAAINARLGCSVTDYLNRWRVAEAKRLLRDPAQQRYTVEGLGLEAGFGSRSSFYRIFRQHTGASPANYRQGGR